MTSTPYNQDETCDGCGKDASVCECKVFQVDITGTAWAERGATFRVHAPTADAARAIVAAANEVDVTRVQAFEVQS